MIDPTAMINCEEFVIGEGAIIRAHAEIYGKRVVIGRDAFIDEYAVIGGGSADHGEFIAGDFLHMGMFSQVNTAQAVHIGDEVGIGIGTRIFTHGAYLSEFDGFPVSFESVTIGSRVWLPSATVLPGVIIGDDVVIAAGSLVTSDIPSGSLAGGTPAKILRKDAYPNIPLDRVDMLKQICDEVKTGHVVGLGIVVDNALFDINARTIHGPVTDDTERLKNQLRRHGIRFRYGEVNGEYQPWTHCG